MSRIEPIRISAGRFRAMRADPFTTTDQIAATFGMHRSSVAGVAKRLGLPPAKCGAKSRPIPPLFAEMWDFGVSGQYLAQHFGFSRNYLARVAARAGLEPRRQGGRYHATVEDFMTARLASCLAQAAARESMAAVDHWRAA